MLRLTKVYSQRFRKGGLVLSIICKGWIAEESSDSNKVLCKYCKVTFRARYADIKQPDA